MTHAVLPGLIARKSGSIVNIGSTAGLVGDYMLPVYSAMKGSVHSFTIDLAKEVGQHGVRINAIAPYATFATSPGAFSTGSRFNQANDFVRKHSTSAEDDAIRQRRTFVGLLASRRKWQQSSSCSLPNAPTSSRARSGPSTAAHYSDPRCARGAYMPLAAFDYEGSS